MPLAAPQRLKLAHALLWIVPLLRSSNCLIARAASGVIAPHTLALSRWSLAFVLMLPLAWRGLRRAGRPWLAAEWRQLLMLGGLGLVVAAAVLPGMVAYPAYSFMLRELGAARTALVLYLGPVYAALSAWVLLSEPPQAHHAIGAAMILPSIWFATRVAARPAVAADLQARSRSGDK